LPDKSELLVEDTLIEFGAEVLGTIHSGVSAPRQGRALPPQALRAPKTNHDIWIERPPAAMRWPTKASIPKPLQAYIGHRSINSTTRYAALAPGRFKNIWGKV
jgi:hypothetical protein